MAASKEYEWAWGRSDLVVRFAFACDVAFRPGKGSMKSSVSFWEAKNMLEKLNVHFNHIRLVTKGQPDTPLVVRLSFFKHDAYKNAYETISTQPNNVIHDQGVPVEIRATQVEAAAAATQLPPADPTFNGKPKGCRLDTIRIRGLPAKWFDVNTSTFLDDTLEHSSSSYMKEDHTLHRLFGEFGALSAIEVVPPITSEDENSSDSSLFATTRFDIYIQFKDYDGVLNAMAALSNGRVLCHSSNTKMLVPLHIGVDKTEYLSDSKIRQRRCVHPPTTSSFLQYTCRFAREQRVHEQQAKAAQAAAAEKEALALAAKAKSLLQPLGEELEQLVARADEELDSAPLELKEAADALKKLSEAPTMDQVHSVRKALDAAKKKIESAVLIKEQQAERARRSKWKKEMVAATSSSEDQLAHLKQRLEKTKTVFTQYCDHPAVIADLAAATEAISIHHSMPSEKSLTEADVDQYLKTLRDDVDEAKYMVEAVDARLSMLECFHKLQETVAAIKSPVAKLTAELDLIQKEWSASTEDLNNKIEKAEHLLQTANRLAELVNRYDELEEPNKEDSALHERYEKCGTSLREDSALDDVEALENELNEIVQLIKSYQSEIENKMKEANSISAQMQRVSEARKRLRAWRDEHGLSKEFQTERFYHMQDRGEINQVKKPRQISRLTPESGLIRSTIFIKDAETGEMMAAKTEEERRAEEMERLRLQVFESQKRKKVGIEINQQKEKELRDQVLKSMKAK
ncbi:A kinase (PRKA) anchor protein 17A [Aphanomyces cochlioides]|nr:A kinase (PRKA) anchor protein 17A [Aphanomyces cochlioides]